MSEFITSQVDRFYKIFIPLLKFTNLKTRTLSADELKSFVKPYNMHIVRKLRDVLWTNPWIIEEFVNENPYKMCEENLQTVTDWKNFLYGDFIIGKIIRGRGLFIPKDSPKDFYFVTPLITPFDEVLLEIPVFVRAAILPFENVIIYDGILASYAISFGFGIRRDINNRYINAKELHTIKTSMLPPASLTNKQKQSQNERTNKSVLRYFKIYSRLEGRSEKIMNRDCETAAVFGTFLNSEPGGINSLREISLEKFIEYISAITDISKSMKIGLRRFFEYLVYTNRIDWELAEDILFIVLNL